MRSASGMSGKLRRNSLSNSAVDRVSADERVAARGESALGKRVLNRFAADEAFIGVCSSGIPLMPSLCGFHASDVLTAR